MKRVLAAACSSIVGSFAVLPIIKPAQQHLEASLKQGLLGLPCELPLICLQHPGFACSFPSCCRIPVCNPSRQQASSQHQLGSLQLGTKVR